MLVEGESAREDPFLTQRLIFEQVAKFCSVCQDAIDEDDEADHTLTDTPEVLYEVLFYKGENRRAFPPFQSKWELISLWSRFITGCA